MYSFSQILITLEKNYATTTFKFSFFNRIVDMWNTLPLPVRQATNIASFKTGVFSCKCVSFFFLFNR